MSLFWFDRFDPCEARYNEHLGDETSSREIHRRLLRIALADADISLVSYYRASWYDFQYTLANWEGLETVAYAHRAEAIDYQGKMDSALELLDTHRMWTACNELRFLLARLLVRSSNPGNVQSNSFDLVSTCCTGSKTRQNHDPRSVVFYSKCECVSISAAVTSCSRLKS